ncbi:MAG: redoxin domain-containing protein [Ktedonobacterales bacterium]
MGQHLDGQLAPLLPRTTAPDFTLPHTPSARLSLHSLRGRHVVLVFYPFDWEPVSREQLTLYQDFGDDFARLGVRLLGISTDHIWSHESFARDARIRFPLLADAQPHGTVARQYGVYRPARGVSARALFVLDRLGIVRFGQVYPDQLNPGVDGILTTLEAIAADDHQAGED